MADVGKSGYVGTVLGRLYGYNLSTDIYIVVQILVRVPLTISPIWGTAV